ncbi:ABC transporter [Candidatus Nitrosoglobus terrae]|uniref:ABC transporter n=1 Tax=Candidatus Nitrosoglobus terrae TaxID=1630141 RepID=A0A1Q2SM86_9GAMM|nr:ABC-type transport auxiliary lipoprotein family protein [Candidatus Nitrosoglobus terrae]BAW80232.1 ABC transporter [Candidatus Nitrosoglobus terrae]
MMSARLNYLVCLFALTFAGCSLFGSQKEVVENHYTLEVKRVLDQPSPKARERVLEVSQFRISPRYQSQTLVYQKGDSWYHTEKNQAFMLPPQVLVTDQVTRYLGNSGLFGAIVEGESRLKVTHLLEGAITALYGDFTDPKGLQAVMEIQFFLLDPLATNPPKIVFQTGFRIEAEIPSSTPQALIQGWNKGLETILQNFENDLRRLFKESSLE